MASLPAVPVLDSATQHLLEENNQLLTQIASNIETFKTEENMDLFLLTNNNIRAILERYDIAIAYFSFIPAKELLNSGNEFFPTAVMMETHSIMGRMPSLPVHVNEEHLTSLVHLHRGVRPLACDYIIIEINCGN
nr:unnamed protein product [Digitaria exilis]